MCAVTAPWAEVPNGCPGASLDEGRSVGFLCILLLVSWLHHALRVQIKSFQRLRDSLGSAALGIHLSGHHSSSSQLCAALCPALACKMRLSWRNADLFPLVLASLRSCHSLCLQVHFCSASVKHDYSWVSLGSAGGSSSPRSFRCLKITWNLKPMWVRLPLQKRGGGLWLSKGQFLSLSPLSSSNKPGRLPCTRAANRGVLG